MSQKKKNDAKKISRSMLIKWNIDLLRSEYIKCKFIVNIY